MAALNALDRAEQRVRAHGPSDLALREARLRHDDEAHNFKFAVGVLVVKRPETLVVVIVSRCRVVLEST